MKKVTRSKDFVKNEYSAKWNCARNADDIDAAFAAAALEYCIASEEEVVTSRMLDAVYMGANRKLDWDSLMAYRAEIIKNLVSPYITQRICELGCGIGINFHYLSRLGEIYGGDLVEDAVEIANSFGFNVELFDFYSISDYDIIKPDSVVLTVHAIEQLPDARPFIEGLRSQKDRIVAVCHLEPLMGVNERQDEYMSNKDYNRNLVPLLESNDIKVLHRRDAVLGAHPLNVSSTICWKFR